MVEPIYKQNFTIGISMVDTNKKLKLSSLETIFMECASMHSGKMRLGIEDTKRMNITWVLSKMRIKIDRMPEVWEHIYVETYPLKPSKIAFDRDFIVKDESGKKIIIATSRWCLIDIEKRRPVAQETLDFDYPEIIGKQNFEPLFFALIEPGINSTRKEHKILYSDLDFNGHITNTKYFDIALDLLDKTTIENLKIGEVEIHFVSEAPFDSKLYINYEKHNNIWSFEGKSGNDNRVFLLNLIEK